MYVRKAIVDMADLPLQGIRVIDITVVWAGPGCTSLLGDLGAEVIRIEDVHHFPNSTRGLAPHLSREQAAGAGYIGGAYPDSDPGAQPYNRHAMFNSHGRNKKSVTMNLRDPQGREAFLSLVKASDVLVENNSLRVIRNLDIDFDVLHDVNPRLVMLRMPPLGLSGPFSEFVGYGPNFNALTGIVAMSGYRNTDPSTAGDNYHMDEVAGPAGAFAVMAALRRRRRTGVGELIELAQSENVAQDVGEYVLDTQMNGGRTPELIGNADPVMVQAVFPTAGQDRWIAVSLRDDEDWRAFVDVLGHPAWCDEERFATVVSRRENEAELEGLVEGLTRGMDAYELFHLLQARGVLAGPVSTESMVNGDPHWSARGYFRPLARDDLGVYLHPGHPWRASALELAWNRAAPRLGEDNEYVYKELLGISDEAYDAMVARGDIGVEYRV